MNIGDLIAAALGAAAGFLIGHYRRGNNISATLTQIAEDTEATMATAEELKQAVTDIGNSVASGFAEVAREIGETAAEIAALKDKIAGNAAQQQAIDEAVSGLRDLKTAVESKAQEAQSALDALQTKVEEPPTEPPAEPPVEQPPSEPRFRR